MKRNSTNLRLDILGADIPGERCNRQSATPTEQNPREGLQLGQILILKEARLQIAHSHVIFISFCWFLFISSGQLTSLRQHVLSSISVIMVMMILKNLVGPGTAAPQCGSCSDKKGTDLFIIGRQTVFSQIPLTADDPATAPLALPTVR
ncbi:MAG: hypothetical protein WCP58_11175 [bacterium]